MCLVSEKIENKGLHSLICACLTYDSCLLSNEELKCNATKLNVRIGIITNLNLGNLFSCLGCNW